MNQKCISASVHGNWWIQSFLSPPLQKVSEPKFCVDLYIDMNRMIFEQDCLAECMVKHCMVNSILRMIVHGLQERDLCSSCPLLILANTALFSQPEERSNRSPH